MREFQIISDDVFLNRILKMNKIYEFVDCESLVSSGSYLADILSRNYSIINLERMFYDEYLSSWCYSDNGMIPEYRDIRINDELRYFLGVVSIAKYDNNAYTININGIKHTIRLIGYRFKVIELDSKSFIRIRKLDSYDYSEDFKFLYCKLVSDDRISFTFKYNNSKLNLIIGLNNGFIYYSTFTPSVGYGNSRSEFYYDKNEFNNISNLNFSYIRGFDSKCRILNNWKIGNEFIVRI